MKSLNTGACSFGRSVPLIVVTAACLFAMPFKALAENGDEIENPYKDLPSQGVLSESVKSGGKKLAIPMPFGGLDGVGSSAAPISGSVSRLNSREFLMRVYNNTKDGTFSASVSVHQFNNRGASVKTDSYSYTLKPGETAERRVPARQGVDRAELELRSWKDLTRRAKPTAEPTPGFKPGKTDATENLPSEELEADLGSLGEGS